METIFLSYTYASHPNHQTQLDCLHRCAIDVIETMGIRVVTGRDLAGDRLSPALQQRIAGTDALVALITPQDDGHGGLAEPQYVLSELYTARGGGKPTFYVKHVDINVRGLAANDEHFRYEPGTELEFVLKLMRTIAIWKAEHGHASRVHIEPAALAQNYDERRGDYCEFQRIGADGIHHDYLRTTVKMQPGALYVALPKMPSADMVRLRMRVDQKLWGSRNVINPFVGGALLEEGQ